MGEKEFAIASFFSNNAVFADLCNYYVYNGKEVVRPEGLRERNIRDVCIRGKFEADEEDCVPCKLKILRLAEYDGIVYALIVIIEPDEEEGEENESLNLFQNLEFVKENVKHLCENDIREEMDQQSKTPVIPVVLLLRPED